MTIEDGTYCQYCTDESGHLQPFAERFERMVQFALKRGATDRAVAEAQTLDYMATMPAWRDHPKLISRD